MQTHTLWQLAPPKLASQSPLGLLPQPGRQQQLSLPKQASKQYLSLSLLPLSLIHIHTHSQRVAGALKQTLSSLKPKSYSYHPVFLPPFCLLLSLQAPTPKRRREREREKQKLCLPPAVPPCYGIRRGGWARIGAAAVAEVKQAGDLDPRHHHRVSHGGDGVGGGGGGGGQQEADEHHHHYHHHHRLLQLHQEVQDQEPPPVPVFQLQHLQAASVRQPGSSASSAEYALRAPMGDAGQSHHHGFQPQLLSFGGVGHHHLHQFTAQAAQPQPPTASHTRARGGAGGEIVAATPASHSRVRGGGGGEIVAVQGGHIVRSTGRKDRHSKVCTARGPRDRRVRLSAHTAIQFYDVQDRLGYDRPSKAVDWLIKNAKDAIDKLDVLPAWQPTAAAPAASNAAAPPSSSTHPDSAENSDDQAQAITVAQAAFEFAGAGGSIGGSGGTSFLPPSLDSDAIADTIKSFFPMGGTAGGEAAASTAAAQSSAMGFQSYTPDLLSRTGSQSQELQLSLQPLQDPMFHDQQQHRSHGHGGNGTAQQALFPGAPNYSFGGGAMWAEQAQNQRMVSWNVPDPGVGGGGSTGGPGGYLFNVSQQASHMQAALGGQSQFFFQRGPLQSSNQPSDRGWPETVEANNPMQHHQGGLSPSAVSAIGFAPGISFSGFRIPARIQGEEEHNGNGDKPPPSVSSASQH